MNRRATPQYSWICHRCDAVNKPNTDFCASCGFHALASANQLPGPVARADSTDSDERQPSLLFFFPEIIPAAIIVLAGPIWGLRLVMDHFPQGLAYLFISISGGYAFYFCMVRRCRWLLAVVIVGVILVALGVDSSLPNDASVFKRSSATKNCVPAQ